MIVGGARGEASGIERAGKVLPASPVRKGRKVLPASPVRVFKLQPAFICGRRGGGVRVGLEGRSFEVFTCGPGYSRFARTLKGRGFGISGGVFVFRLSFVKKIQSERMCFRKITGMGGGWLAEMANLVFYGGYTVLERMGERMGRTVISDE